jgi:hypothetical protein
MNQLDVYRRILRDTIRVDMPLEDILLRALVLHTHSIALRPDVDLDDVQRNVGELGLVLAPLTRTHVVNLVASLWPKDSEWGREDFWFVHYGQVVPYELFEQVPDEMRNKALAARKSIEDHSLVDKLIEE